LNPKAAVERIGSSGSATGATAVEGALAIENVAVIAMDGAPEASRVRRGMTVVVEGGRVRAVGPAGKVEVPRGATHIDGTGRYLIPGLRDMHIHLVGETGERALRRLLAFGVTGARVMAGSPAVLQFRERIRRGELSGPDLYVAGPILEGVAPAGFEELIDNRGKVIVHDSVEAARVVREQSTAGYDFIKIYNNLPADAFRGIVVEARRLRLPVAGHVARAVGLDGALSARQASIEHLRAYERALVPVNAPQQPGPDLRSVTLSWAYADAAKIRAVAERTRDAGVWNVPTLTTRLAFASDSEAASYLRSEGATAEQANTYLARRRSIPWLSNFTPADFVAAKAGYAVQDSLVRALVAVGAGVMAGTDSPPYGNALHRELELLVAAGLTPYQALESATRSPAKFLDLKDGGGTVAVGAPADLVLLDANPLEKISNTRSIRGVVRRGVWLDRAALDSLLADAAASTAGEPESSSSPDSRRAIIETADEKNIGPQKRIKLLDPKAALDLIVR
ncbi:MAG TPA: amidohydrolase family protein, partial [Gemmatimonadaceae bacterium]|nr:amidohydrolase family protein [Gemmatimonadaceae bacterium]